VGVLPTVKNRLTPVAQRLRRDSTDAESLLWSRLRADQLGARFIRQHPIGPYIADFACRKARLVIELDGGQHALAVEADAERTKVIEAHGYLVLRFWNNDVMENIEGVLMEIVRTLEAAKHQD